MAIRTSLIKSAKRVHDLGEVFTPDFLVERMLDQFPPDAWLPKKNWLEPTCGNGQFILGVLRRKLSHGHLLLRALDTTFGCDIMPDNISECHIRIYQEIVLPRAKNVERWQAACLVENNIRPTKDSLKEDFTKWQRFADLPQSHQDGMRRKIQSILDMVDGNSATNLKTDTDRRLFQELSFLSEDNYVSISRQAPESCSKSR